jgi:hypothetical protein
MPRETTVRGTAVILAIGALLLGLRGAAAADDAPAAGDRIVPPSTYVEGIETPGKTGGSDSEVDAAAAQAAAAKATAPAAAAGLWQGGAEIAADVIVGRPTALVATVAGSALFALSLPITIPSGRYAEARERLVEEPGKRLIGPIGK